MESLDTSGSNSLMPVRQGWISPPLPPPLWIGRWSKAFGLLEEKEGDVEAFKLTAALKWEEDDDDGSL